MSEDQEKITFESLRKNNTALRKTSLIKISVKNEKNEELSLSDTFDQIKDYIKENQTKIEDSISLIASFINGPLDNTNRSFVLGYLYAKWIQKLESEENSKYHIEYTERQLSEEEIRHLAADMIDKNLEIGKDISKKLRDGSIKPEDIDMV